MDPLAGSSWSAPGTVAGFARSAPNAVLMSFAESALKRSSGAHVLDIGCGAGRNAVPLARLGWTVIGTDLSWPMLAAATDRARAEHLEGRFRAILAPMENLPARDRSVDLVIAHGIWNLARHRRSIPTGPRRGGSSGEARRGAVRVHLLAQHVSGADEAVARSRSRSPSSPANRNAPHRGTTRRRVVRVGFVRDPGVPFAGTTCRSRGRFRSARRPRSTKPRSAVRPDSVLASSCSQRVRHDMASTPHAAPACTTREPLSCAFCWLRC